MHSIEFLNALFLLCSHTTMSDCPSCMSEPEVCLPSGNSTNFIPATLPRNITGDSSLFLFSNTFPILVRPCICFGCTFLAKYLTFDSLYSKQLTSLLDHIYKKFRANDIIPVAYRLSMSKNVVISRLCIITTTCDDLVAFSEPDVSTLSIYRYNLTGSVFSSQSM